MPAGEGPPAALARALGPHPRSPPRGRTVAPSSRLHGSCTARRSPPAGSLHRACSPRSSGAHRGPPGPPGAGARQGKVPLDFREPGFVSSGKTRGHRNDRCDREFTLMNSHRREARHPLGALGEAPWGRGCAQSAHWIPRKEGGRLRTGPCGCSGCGRRAVPGVRYLPG